MRLWLQENRYTSHQSMNELITALGQSLLRNLLGKMKEVTGPAWFQSLPMKLRMLSVVRNQI